MSDLEEILLAQVRSDSLPEPEREFRFCKRRYLADFAWPAYWLLVEVEGGSWVQGRHTRGTGYESDCRKYNLATLAGWRVLRFTGDQVKSGEARRAIREALEYGPG